MNASVIELEGSIHQRVQKLLPWRVIGQLAQTEEKLVDEHLASCQECRADLVWERRLSAVQPEAGAAPDMEGALARLLPQLEPRAAANGSWMRWALAAQMLIIAGLGLLLFRQAPAEYRLLGAQGQGSANMVVIFRPDASERELRSVLTANAATVVRGPTEANAWLISVPAQRLDKVLAAMRASETVSLAEPLQGME